jgi:hypothetical protein
MTRKRNGMLQYALAVSVSLLVCGTVSAQEMGKPVARSEIKWAPAPPVMPAGMEVAVLAGNPEKEGPFTVRLKMPANYVFPPHNIPISETVTVLSGAMLVGIGDKFDHAKAERMQEGSFVELVRQPYFGPLLNSVPSMPPPIFNPSSPYTVPPSPETPVSPASPGSVFH